MGDILFFLRKMANVKGMRRYSAKLKKNEDGISLIILQYSKAHSPLSPHFLFAVDAVAGFRHQFHPYLRNDVVALLADAVSALLDAKISVFEVDKPFLEVADFRLNRVMAYLFAHVGVNGRVVGRMVGIGKRIIFFQVFYLEEYFFLLFLYQFFLACDERFR